MAEAVVWRVSEPGAVASRFWEDEAVLYDERTGATHRLGVVTTLVWQLLVSKAPGGADEAALQSALVAAGHADMDTSPALVASIVEEFARLGLVVEA